MAVRKSQCGEVFLAASSCAALLAALIVRVQGGNPVLLNPQSQVAQALDHLRAAETFTILGRASAENEPAASTGSG